MKLKRVGMVNKKAKESIRPGTYDAVLTGITDEVDGYDVDAAFQVEYDVFVTESKKIAYHEVFLNDLGNSRTATFDAWVRDSGYDLEKSEDLIGLKMRLTFLKQSKNGRTFTNITKREGV